MEIGNGKGLLLSDRLNVRYFSHREEFANSLIFAADDEIVYIQYGVMKRELGADRQGIVTYVFTTEDAVGEEIERLCKKSGIQEIVCDDKVPVVLFEELKKNGFTISVDRNCFAEVRDVKTDWEIEQLSIASRITEEALEAVLKKIAPGVTELQVAALLEYEMRIRGSEESNKTIVAAGINGAGPHHWPTDYAIKKGDFITMDYGCTFNGYHSDLTRTVIIGEPSEKQREVYEVVLKAQEAGEAFLKAGVTGKEVDEAARRIIEEAGYGQYFVHNLGHGIGLDIHEGTGLTRQSEVKLKEGMVVSVEPGIYIEGFGGVRIENILRVGKETSETLEKSSKQLIVL